MIEKMSGVSVLSLWLSSTHSQASCSVGCSAGSTVLRVSSVGTIELPISSGWAKKVTNHLRNCKSGLHESLAYKNLQTYTLTDPSQLPQAHLPRNHTASLFH